MKLVLRSSGGVTGPAGATVRTLDLETAPEPTRRRGHELVAAAHVFDRPQKILLAKPRPWDFNYQLELADQGRTHRIDLHLDAVDEPLRALVAWIEEHALPHSAITE